MDFWDTILTLFCVVIFVVCSAHFCGTGKVKKSL